MCAECSSRVPWIAGTSFGIERCRYDAFVVGEWILVRARARVWRWEERRALMRGRWVGRDVHCGVEDRRVWVDDVGIGEVM